MQAPNRTRLFYALLRTMCVSRELPRPQTTHTSRATPKWETIILDGYQLLTQYQRALRDPQSMFVHRGVHRSWPSLLKIDFFLFSTRLGDLAFLKLQLFSVWLRRRVFVCIYIIKFVNDRLLYFSKLWAPGLSCASANSTSTYRKTWVPKTLCCPCSSKSKFSLAYWLTWLHTVKFWKKAPPCMRPVSNVVVLPCRTK